MHNLGMLLLAIYLILTGIMAVVPQFSFPYHSMVLGVLAIVAGVLIILKK